VGEQAEVGWIKVIAGQDKASWRGYRSSSRCSQGRRQSAQTSAAEASSERAVSTSADPTRSPPETDNHGEIVSSPSKPASMSVYRSAAIDEVNGRGHAELHYSGGIEITVRLQQR
jgi:hypothetical protein